MGGLPSAGVLFFNPGGPGEDATELLPVFVDALPKAVQRAFTFVTFDPRGTSTEDPLACATTPIAPAAATSALPAPTALGGPLPSSRVFAPLAEQCGRSSQGVDTVTAANDMDHIRALLGVAKISFDGWSYGTVLGATYAQLFPTHLRALVLDGVVDVRASLAAQAREQAPAIESQLTQVLTTCVAPTCPLGRDAIGAYRAFTAELAAHPLPDASGTPVTIGDLDAAAVGALTTPVEIPTFEGAVASAIGGNGGPLRAQALSTEENVDGTSLVDVSWTIMCNDEATHLGPRAAGALASTLSTRFPLVGAYAASDNVAGCTTWPTSSQPVPAIAPVGAPPALVMSTSHDPLTPLVGAKRTAAVLPGSRLVVWQGLGHVWMVTDAGDPCMDQVLTAYLVDLRLPRRGLVCR